MFMIAKGWFKCFWMFFDSRSGGLISCGVFFEYEYKRYVRFCDIKSFSYLN